MVVLAITTVAVILIVVGVVAVVGVIFVALGPMSSREQARDDLGAEMGPLGTARLSQDQTREELGDDSGWAGPDAEEKLDQRFE
jgi:hypothetical protein